MVWTEEKSIEMGRIKVLLGSNGGKYPHCNTIFIDDERPTLIDPGCSYRRLKKMVDEKSIETIILSHYHEDHTRCARLFKFCEILAHEKDLEGVRSIEGLMECYGVEGHYSEQIWLNILVNGLMLKDLPQAKPLPDEEIDFGKTKAMVVHTPGHTPGHTCLLFAEEGILFTADIDLDRFGPYYGDACSSLSDMLSSINTIREIAPETIVTGHMEGVVTKNIPERLLAYRDVIFQREEKIVDALENPLSIWSICQKHLIYGKQFEPRTIFDLIESNMIREHLIRLIAEGRVDQVADDLFIRK